MILSILALTVGLANGSTYCSRVIDIQVISRDRVLVSCPNQLLVKSLSDQANGAISLGPVEPVFGCGGITTSDKLCRSTVNSHTHIDLRRGQCDAVPYETSLVASIDDDQVVVCSSSQKLNGTTTMGSGYCKIFDLDAQAEIQCSCAKEPGKKSALLGEYQAVTQMSSASVSRVISNSGKDGEEMKHLLVFNQYHPYPFNDDHVHAIALHLVHW